MSTNLSPWLDEELRREFEERGESTSEGPRPILEEWWAGRHLPGIEFREGLAGHVAALRRWCTEAGDGNPLQNGAGWIGPK